MEPQGSVLTADYVLGLYRWGLQQPQERGLRTFIREVRQLYDMKRPVKIPKEYRAIAQEVRTPFMRDIAVRVTASLTKDPPVRLVEPRDDTNDTKHAAAIAGNWLMGITADMTRIAPVDVVYMDALALTRDSESVIKIVHRPEAWANFPERNGEDAKKYLGRAAKYAKGGVIDPFAWREVDRLQMLFGDGEYGDTWALEYGEYATPYLAHDVRPDPDNPKSELLIAGQPQPEGGPGGGFASKTVKYELFTQDDWAVVVNGKMAPGFPRENPYKPFLPYVRATAPPALYPLRYLVPALDALLTMKLNWAYLSAFPVVVIEALAGVKQLLDGALPTGDTGEPPADFKVWNPGKGWFAPPGYTMKFLEPPATGRDLDVMIGEFREMIDIVGIPNVMRGIGGARQPGYSINQLASASQTTYRKITEALQRQQENVARLLFNCVKYVDQPVFILGSEGDAKKWIGLKPTGDVQQNVAPVDQLGPPKCMFRPVLPTDEQAMSMIGLQELNAPRPLLSHATILSRRLQIADPEGEIDNIWAEKALEEEPINATIKLAAMKDAGLPVPGIPPTVQPNTTTMLQPSDATNQGEPTISNLTQPATPNEAIPPRQGGREAGAYPGQP